MEQRIERSGPSQLPEGRLRRFGYELLDVGANFPGTPPPLSEEKLNEIESHGFELEVIQDYLDRLSRSRDIADQRTAAVLRGAFNDLLSRIPDSPETDQLTEIEPAA